MKSAEHLIRVAAMVALLAPSHAAATWSIVAVDADTQQVGAAGATCGPFVWGIAQLAPGHGAVVAQYATNTGSRKAAAAELEAGATPEEALAVITAPGYDNSLGIRQFGIAALSGPSAAFTGEDCDDWKGSLSEVGFSVQGNTLTSEAVIQAARDAFVAADDQPLDERLLRALEAGAAEGGDQRCDPAVAAKSAFVFVAGPSDDRPAVDLTASDKNGAVASLREKFDSGKRQGCHCNSTNGLSRAEGTLLPFLAGLLLLVRRKQPNAR